MIIDKEKFNRPFLSSYHHHRLFLVFFLTGSFVLDTMIQLLFDAHHHHDRLYLIQWSVSTSTVATNRIVCIWYNDPHPHPCSPLPWSFIFDTMILLNIKLHHYHDHLYSIQRLLWSSWCLFYSLYSSPSSHNEVLTSSRLQHLCLALVLSDLLKSNNSINLVNFGLGRGLVKMSETLSSIGTYFTWILPSSTTSWMKWYHRSMCFVLAWNLLSFASAMAPWLLHEMVSGFSSPPRISFINSSARTWLHASMRRTPPLYSTTTWLLASLSSRRLPRCRNGTRIWILNACAFD